MGIVTSALAHHGAISSSCVIHYQEAFERKFAGIPLARCNHTVLGRDGFIEFWCAPCPVRHSGGSLQVYRWLGAIIRYSAGMTSSHSLVPTWMPRMCMLSVRDERHQALCKDVRNVIGYTMPYHCTGVAECRMTCPSFTAIPRQQSGRYTAGLVQSHSTRQG